MEKDYSLSFARVVATFFIILCHITSMWGGNISFLGSVFDVGVPVFLLISGILYGRKNYDNIKVYYIKNYIKLCIPMYLWLAVLLVCYAFVGERYSCLTVGSYLLNLQGISWIIDYINIKLIGDVGILWFLTIIMFCYIIYPFVMKYHEVIANKRILLLSGIVILLLHYMKIHLWYLWEFVFGIYFAYEILKLVKIKRWVCGLSMLCFVLQGIKLVIRYYADGTIFYQYLVSSFSHFILGLWIIVMCYVFCQRFEHFCRTKIIDFFDRISMYIYIVHYSFLKGIFSGELLSIAKKSKTIWFFCYIFVVVGSAYVLCITSQLLIKKVNNLLLNKQ